MAGAAAVPLESDSGMVLSERREQRTMRLEDGGISLNWALPGEA